MSSRGTPQAPDYPNTGSQRGYITNCGFSLAEALMEKSAQSDNGNSYTHPMFWAPFSLVSDGGR